MDVLEGVRGELSYLASSPDVPDHAARIDALAAIPEQIVRFLAARLEQGIPEREPMLETLARRHYREHELHDLRTLTVGRRPFVVCDYSLDDRPTHLVTTLGTLDELADPQARDGLVESVTAQFDCFESTKGCIKFTDERDLPTIAFDALVVRRRDEIDAALSKPRRH